jgi:alginate O-acetyltransferase complex protein AlgI
MHASLIFIERKLKPVRTKIKWLGLPLIGWGITTLLVMLSWLPFRAENLEVTFGMFSKIITPSEYLKIGMRENTYIVTFVVTILFLVTYYLQEYLAEFWKKTPKLSFGIGVLKLSIVILLVFTFLRPISQFIYFQF